MKILYTLHYILTSRDAENLVDGIYGPVKFTTRCEAQDVLQQVLVGEVLKYALADFIDYAISKGIDISLYSNIAGAITPREAEIMIIELHELFCFDSFVPWAQEALSEFVLFDYKICEAD